MKLLENTKLDLNLNSRWVEWLTGMSRWYLENGFWKTVHRLGPTLVLLIRPLKDTCPDSAQGDWLVLGVVSMPNVTGSDELWKKGKMANIEKKIEKSSERTIDNAANLSLMRRNTVAHAWKVTVRKEP